MSIAVRACAVAAVAAAAGAFECAVVSGSSMAPTLADGDLVIAAAWKSPATGDIVLLRDGRALIVHRVAGTTVDGDLITKGDANPVADFEPSAVEDVCGVVVLVLPLAGWV